MPDREPGRGAHAERNGLAVQVTCVAPGLLDGVAKRVAKIKQGAFARRLELVAFNNAGLDRDAFLDDLAG